MRSYEAHEMFILLGMNVTVMDFDYNRPIGTRNIELRSTLRSGLVVVRYVIMKGERAAG